MAKVFIGLPIYNGEHLMREAIDALLNQSFSDFTLFISDDASTDGTRTICEAYVARDRRIQYYRQEKNLGMFANFKFVLDNANAKYFMWVAHDDIREKEYLQACVEKLENNQNLGLVTTVVRLIDSVGRTLADEEEVTCLSGKPGLTNVARYVLQPEGLGKCNLIYGLFRTDVARATWNAYPQRKVFGQDYMFTLALISRFEVLIVKKSLFKKRLGGYSSPELLSHAKAEVVQKLSPQERRKGIIPFKRFWGYFAGYMEALRGTPYQAFAALLLLLRLPHSFLVYAKERNYKKFFNKIVSKTISCE